MSHREVTWLNQDHAHPESAGVKKRTQCSNSRAHALNHQNRLLLGATCWLSTILRKPRCLHHHAPTPLSPGWDEHSHLQCSTHLELLAGVAMKVRVKARTEPWDFPSTSTTNNNAPLESHMLHMPTQCSPVRVWLDTHAEGDSCSLGVGESGMGMATVETVCSQWQGLYYVTGAVTTTSQVHSIHFSQLPERWVLLAPFCKRGNLEVK